MTFVSERAKRTAYGGKDDQREQVVALACTAGDNAVRRLRTGVPQLFRLLRQLQVLRPAAITIHALRRLRLPFVRGVAVSVRTTAIGGSNGLRSGQR